MLVPFVHCHLLHHMGALRFGICLYSSTCFLDKTEAFEVSQPVRDVVHQCCSQHCDRLCTRCPPNTHHQKPEPSAPSEASTHWNFRHRRFVSICICPNSSHCFSLPPPPLSMWQTKYRSGVWFRENAVFSTIILLQCSF